MHLSNVDGPLIAPPPVLDDGIGGMMTTVTFVVCKNRKVPAENDKAVRYWAVLRFGQRKGEVRSVQTVTCVLSTDLWF